MNNEEITEKLNTDSNLLDTMESLIEEFSPKEILERGEIVDGTVISIQNNGLVIDLGQKSEEVHRFHCFERERETLNLYDIK